MDFQSVKSPKRRKYLKTIHIAVQFTISATETKTKHRFIIQYYNYVDLFYFSII